ARVTVARVVRRDAVPTQVDPEARVGDEGVAADGVAGPRGGEHAAAAVVGDEVAGPGGRPPDLVAGGGRDPHAVRRIAQIEGAGGIGPDGVPLDDIARCTGPGDPDAPAAIARDHVPGPGG